MKKFIRLLAAAFVLVVLVGCSSTSEQPVEIVSFKGPVPPINPGGPNIEIVVKNVSNAPVVALKAEPDIKGAPGQHYVLSFNVTESSPLEPGQTAAAAMTLINGGFQEGTEYPVTLSGTLLGGRQFSYSVQAKITSP